MWNLKMRNLSYWWYVLFLCGVVVCHAKKCVFLGTSSFALFNPRERDGCTQHWIMLRDALQKRGYTVTATFELDQKEQVDVIFVLNSACRKENFKKKAWKQCPCRILFMLESMATDPNSFAVDYHAHFTRVLTLHDAFIGTHKRYVKICYPQPSLMLDASVPFEQRKFLTMIVSNKHSPYPGSLYEQRIADLLFFEQYVPHLVDFYGAGWPEGKFASYRGSVKNKKEILRHYAYCLCYENVGDSPGYITEKIFDALVAGCIPIYRGAPNITQYIPSSCFIDRRAFQSARELYGYLKMINAESYATYVTAIKKFLGSPQAQRFSLDHFVQTVLRVVERKP